MPRKEAEKTVHDFHPISLLSEVYKIIGTILATRLKKVMNSLVLIFSVEVWKAGIFKKAF